MEQARNRCKRLIRSTGVMRAACQEGNLGNVGDPFFRCGVVARNRDMSFWPGRESERGIVPMKLGNADGGKAPCFWRAFDGSEKR